MEEGVLKQRLDYVRSRIREAAASAESPPAAFLHRTQSRGGCLSKGEIMLSRATKSMEEVGA